MKNKSLVILITFAVTLLSIFYLHFSYISYRIQNKAEKIATDEKGNIDFDKKQNYLESLWKKPVYKFLGLFNYTYEDIKGMELTQGLDLQGGMNVTLEVSPIELIKSISGNNQNEHFLGALEDAQKLSIKQTKISYIDLFYQSFKKRDQQGKLSKIFATVSNKAKIKYDSSDAEIIKILKKENDEAIDRCLYIIRSRIDRFGTTQANIQKLPGTGRIQIELPGVNNPSRVRKLLQNVARLSFWKVYDYESLESVFETIDDKIIEEQHEKAIKGQRIVFKSPFKSKYGRYIYPVSEVKLVKEALKREDIKSMFPKNVKFLWEVKSKKIKGEEIMTLYPIEKTKRGNKALLEGDVVTNAQQSFEPGTSRPTVSMQMNVRGSRIWKKVTRESIGKQIAIVLDDRVYSAPVVNDEIPNGSSAISGNFTIDEAKDLANILKAGSLPAPVKIVEEATVGPTLGKEAQLQGMISMLAGLILVILFMMMYYSKGGIVANLALLFNMIFIIGTLAQLHASLTLPGIAGIVLTIGMSIDANVLIFERIREELKQGMHIKEAISIGYNKAYSSIVDSNLTTFLTGVILYFMGTGPIKGFATTMMIGIVSSFFSAVFITRVIFLWILSKKNGTISFSFSYSKNLLSKLNIDFLGIRKFSYIFSFVIILIGGLLLIPQKGLNLGVDFVGGRSFIVNFTKPIDASKMKTILAANSFENQGTEVKTYGSSNTLKITTSYLINEDSTESDNRVRNALIKGLEDFTGSKFVDTDNLPNKGEFTIGSTSKVGATVANDIKTSSRQSILLSLIMIFLYILIRFRRWQFGLASVIALLHDSLIVIASFTIARAFGFAYEVDQVFIAAILTVIGYSINDTVVVFDRIRENMNASKNKDFGTVANKSINETMSRTLITSFTTFIAVFILFIFGGEVLRGFSFAMLIGIIFGTYSSIFIATPLAVDFSKTKLKLKL
ncbi:MAG: protein translocase subunit SecD [Bacteroidetes bacterium]|nr:protein translocase subunit SecD [Bacteroidota bacterium]